MCVCVCVCVGGGGGGGGGGGEISPSLALDITLIQDVAGRIATERLYWKWWFEGLEQITWYALIWQKSAINIRNNYHVPVIQFLNSSSNYDNKGFLILYWDHSKCLVRKKIWILIPIWRVKIAIEYISAHTSTQACVTTYNTNNHDVLWRWILLHW